jgi:hypothetical protein
MSVYRSSAGSLTDGCVCVVIIGHKQQYLPLLGVEAHATVLSASSRTRLTQTFRNPTNTTLADVRYKFPLFDGVSVVAFTCTIGTRVIKGVVKERTKAKAEYTAAVKHGKKAALLEQFHQAGDVFSCMLGNVGAGELVKVEITYLGELKHDAEVDGLRYTIPTSIAPRYGGNTLLSDTSDQLSSNKPTSMSITVDVDMASGASIKNVRSPSHPISVNIGTTSSASSQEPSLQRASASYSLSESHLDRDFIIQVCASNLGAPSAVIETHPTIPNRRAVMATLVPRFNLPVDSAEIVFVCDRSGSMSEGKRIPNLISALKIFLKSLPVGVLFNICSFGSRFDFLWPKSQPYNQETLEDAVAHVDSFRANYGGTEMFHAIQDTFQQRNLDRNLEVFLMTDGEIWDQQSVFGLIERSVSDSKGAVRLFSLGVGKDVSHALIEGVARAGQGFSQSVSEDEKMDKKVVRMLKGALTPHIHDYSVEITYDKTDDEEFELVEKLDECLVVGEKGQPSPDAVAESDHSRAKQAPISLHDPSVKDEDLEMTGSSEAANQTPLPQLDTPQYLQAPFKIPPLFPFIRTNIYVILSENGHARQPKSVIIKGTSDHGPLLLDMPITALEDRGITIHQLAAKKATQELEESRGWVYHAKSPSGKLVKEEFAMQLSDIAKNEAVKLGVEYQVAGKWCSFIAVDEEGNEGNEAKHDVKPDIAPRIARASFASLAARKSSPMPAAFSQHSVTHTGVENEEILLPEVNVDDDDDADDDVVLACKSSFQEVPDEMPRSLDVSRRRKRVSILESRNVPKPLKRTKTGEKSVEILISLQKFAGNWSWSAQLEGILGITKTATEKVDVSPLSNLDDDARATLCVIVYLKQLQTDEKEVWELVVEKAEGWLSSRCKVDIAELETEVSQAGWFKDS